MILRYVLPDGAQKEVELGENSITIGRGADADISIPDTLASRVHCGISFWDGAFFVRDFKSRNGTFLNDKQIEVSRLNAGDRIRIGDTTLTVESQARKGTDTVIKEIKAEMAKGKGYHTILQEIIQEDEAT